jgi:hypothetical protein
VLALLLLGLAAASWAADQTLLRAKAMLDARNPKGAYDLLAPLQSERAGDPEYDYLLGVAALDLGRNTEAVFALERVLAVQPDNAPARAQIARAYFNLKETDTAKREFETVKAQGVPPDVQATIDRYLDAIGRVPEAERFSARFFVEVIGGYDTNVNGATAVDSIAVPAFGNITFRLEPTSVETPAWFTSAATGMALRNPLTKSTFLLGGASVYARFNFGESDFDTGYLDGYAGLGYRAGRETFTVVAQGNAFNVGDPLYNSSYRNAWGGTAQWTHDFSARSQLATYIQYASLTYPDQEPRDANRYVGGVGWAYAFRGVDPTVYLGVYGGAEIATDDLYDWLGYDLVGLRAGGQKAIDERAYAFASVAVEWRNARGTDPYFLVERKDQQYTAALGLRYLLGHDWWISPQVTYLLNNSNIQLNEYDRWQGFVSLRRDW